MKKQVASLFLSAALLLSVCSVPAFAAQPDAAENAGASDIIVLPAPSETPSDPSSSETTQAPSDETTTAPETTPEATPETHADGDAAQSDETSSQITYVALGDSICAGIGLVNTSDYIGKNLVGLDVADNFHGYPDGCYVGVVANSLGLDRQHAINLGLPALMTSDLVYLLRDGAVPEMNQLSGTQYNYPQMRDYISKADVISIQIGSNDALIPCVVGLGEATNWKSEYLASVVLSGSLRDGAGSALMEGLKKMSLTKSETDATWKLLTSGMSKICEDAYPTASENLRTIVEEIRKLNPDAQIILLSYTNPVPLIPCWSKYFNRMNKYARQLAEVYDLTFVSIPWTQTELDGHPTLSGHKYIANKLLKAIDR